MGSSWSFEVDLNVFFAGAHWSSELAKIPKPTNTSIAIPLPVVDDCGPANLLSAGNAFWLVFVLAVGCVVQLPGSIFLFDRSNFYRFSPELGIADALSVLVLLVKATWRGYQWRESLVAVFVVRESIGRGDLWWRDSERIDVSRFASNNETEGSNNDDAEMAEERMEEYLESKFNETLSLCRFSQIRILGLGLSIVSFLKVLTVLSTSSSNPGVRATCIVAIMYAVSYFILEALTWTLVEFPGRRSIREVPLKNLLPVVRYVDPGNNPFTFPAKQASIGSEIQLRNLPTPAGQSAEQTTFPWNIGVMGTVGTLGLSGPAVWMLLLSSVWNPLTGGIILIASLAVFVILRLIGKFLHRKFFAERPRTTDPETTVEEGQDTTNMRISKLRRIVKWSWRPVTTVNILSTIWIVLLSYYFGKVMQENLSLEQVSKPEWMDWLG